MIETIIVGLIVGIGIGTTLGVLYALWPRATIALMILGLAVSSVGAMMQSTSQLTSDLNLAFHIPYMVGIFFGAQFGRAIPPMVQRDEQRRQIRRLD